METKTISTVNLEKPCYPSSDPEKKFFGISRVYIAPRCRRGRMGTLARRRTEAHNATRQHGEGNTEAGRRNLDNPIPSEEMQTPPAGATE